MKKFISAICILLLFLLSLSGCVESSAPVSSFEPGSSEFIQEQGDTSWIQKATQEKNPVHCENILNETRKKACISRATT